jgi:hypothetical protein
LLKLRAAGQAGEAEDKDETGRTLLRTQSITLDREPDAAGRRLRRASLQALTGKSFMMRRVSSERDVGCSLVGSSGQQGDAPTAVAAADSITAARRRLIAVEAQRIRDAQPYTELEFEMCATGAYSDGELEAARAFDVRHLTRSSAAERQLSVLKYDPTSLASQHALRKGCALVRRNKYSLPESYDPFDPEPTYRERAAKRIGAGRKVWMLEESVWLPRRSVGNAKDFFETPEALRRMFVTDWRMALLHHSLAEYIVKVSRMKHEWKACLAHADECPEVEAVREVLYRHARPIYNAYDYYSLVGRYSTRGIGLLDSFGKRIDSFTEVVGRLEIHSISRAALMAFVEDCGLLGGRGCSPSELDSIWRAVNAEDRTASVDSLNSVRFLNRYEWLQVLVHIAVSRFCRYDPLTGFLRGSPAESIDRLCYDHILGRLPREISHNPNAFRKRHCYAEGTDAVLRSHLASLRALFQAYGALDSDPNVTVRLADKRTMSAGEWLRLVHDVGLLEMGLSTIPMALQAFQWSRIRAIDDYTDAAEISLRHMRFEDFLEGLVRLATAAALPTREEIEAAGCADAAELLHAMRLGEPTAYLEHLERRTLSWDESPKQRTHILLANFLDVIMHNVEAGLRAASSPCAGGPASASASAHAPWARRTKLLTDAEVARFCRHRAAGGGLEHGAMSVEPAEVVAAMRYVETTIMGALENVAAFDGLAPDELEKLRAALSVAKFDDGERVFAQGDEGDAFFLITSGHCEVLRLDTRVGERGGEVCVGRLRQSDCFGERALLHNEPRAASIRAGPGCRLYCVFITRADFERALGKPLEEFQRLKKTVGASAGGGKDLDVAS